MEKKKNIWVGKIVVIVLIIVSIGSYYVFPSVKHVMNQVFKMFASGDFAVVRDFVASYGAYAALISFLLMIFQSIAAPLPAFLITFANANLFGWWQGAILSWSSAMAGAAVWGHYSRDGGYSRDGRGGYSRDGYSRARGYSRSEAKDSMMEQLGAMMEEASNDREREAIRMCMEHLNQE